MALMPNPLLRRLPPPPDPSMLATTLGQHLHGRPGAGAATEAAAAAIPSAGHESLPLELLAAALNQNPVGQFHPGAPTPPPGVPAAPAGSYNPAEFYRHEGQGSYAAHLWESHHPYAMAHGKEPGWVERQNIRDARGPVGSRGTPYTEPLRHRRHVGLAQALQTVHAGGGAVHPAQVG